MTIAVLFILFVILLFCGVPVAISLICSTIVSCAVAGVPLVVVAQKLVNANDSFPLMAIPLFIFAGSIMSRGGVSKRLIALADSCFGWLTGGLGIVANVTGLFFSAISGSSAATSAAVGTIMLPEMEKKGYDKEFSTAIIAASGATGIVIPPSVTMVVFGVITGASVSKLFLGGIVPGMVMGLSMCLVTWLICKKHGYEKTPFLGFRNIAVKFCGAIWGMLMPVIILGGIYGGIFTPTEAAAVAVLYGLVIGFFVYREIHMADMVPIIEDTIISSATIMMIMNAAGVFSWLLTRERIPVLLSNAIVAFTDNRLVFLLLVNILLLVVGMILNPSAAVTIIAPILTPVAVKMGIDPIFFGVLMVCNLAIGSLTPPVGTGLFVASSIADVPLEKVAKASAPFLAILIFDLALFVVFPQLVTCLI